MSVFCSSAGGSPSGLRDLRLGAQVLADRRGVDAAGRGRGVAVGVAAARRPPPPRRRRRRRRTGRASRQARRIGRRVMQGQDTEPRAFKPRAPADDIHGDGRAHGLPSCRRLRPRGARRRSRGHPRRGFALRHARADRAPSRASCSHYDELSVYEVDRAAGMLVPVFALGAYADEVMADSFPVTEGVTGWVVSNRRTRNVAARRPGPDRGRSSRAPRWSPSRSSPCRCWSRTASSAALNVYRIGIGKSFSDAEVAQVERFATMAALAFDSARQRDTLREQARTDGLTGLLNHRACHERLSEEIARAAALGRPLSVVVLDLDHFKAVNDAYGHAEGDKVLVAAAGEAALGRARGRPRRAARRRGVRADPARRRRRARGARPPSARAPRSPRSPSAARR